MKFQEQNAIKIIKPKDIFIYFLLKDDDVVYVGKTTKGLLRPFYHTDKDYDSVMIIYCDYNELDNIEDYYIKKYQPRYNHLVNLNCNYSVTRVLKEIKKSISPTFNLAKLKKVMRLLDIKFIEYNNIRYIEMNDFIRICDYLKGNTL